MKLKEFIEEKIKESPRIFMQGGIVERLVQLESIEQYFNLIFGVELDIEVKHIEQKEGRFFGKGIIESLNKK